MPEAADSTLSEAMSEDESKGNLAVDGGSDQAVAELARYSSQLGKMSEQLKQTSAQIEESVVGVCTSFQGIAGRARATVARATGFLSQDEGPAGGKAGGKPSFANLIEDCGATLVKMMNAAVESGEISRRAIERIQRMDKASQQISEALAQLEEISKGNRMLAFNARIEASHAGAQGAGFAVVAVELIAISWIRTRYMDTPFLQAAFQVVVGGVLVFAVGILIGSS